MTNKDVLDFLTLLVLGATLVCVICYTRIVKKQLDEMIRQRASSLLPKLTANLTQTNQGVTLNLVNIGNGAAVNVTVDDIVVTTATGGTIRQHVNPHLYILPASVARNSVEARLETQRGPIEGTPEQRSVERLITLMPFPDEFNVTTKFEDIDGRKYTQEIRLRRFQIGDFQASVLGNVRPV